MSHICSLSKFASNVCVWVPLTRSREGMCAAAMQLKMTQTATTLWEQNLRDQTGKSAGNGGSRLGRIEESRRFAFDEASSLPFSGLTLFLFCSFHQFFLYLLFSSSRCLFAVLRGRASPIALFDNSIPFIASQIEIIQC